MGNAREQRTAALIVFATLLLSAFFLAQGTTGLVAAQLLPLRVSPTDATPRAAGTISRRERTSDEQILRRNIFDPTTGDLFDPPRDPEDEGDGPSDSEVSVATWTPGAPTQACSGSTVRLVGAVYSPNSPEWSFAALAEGSERSMLFRAGMSLGTNTLLEVGRNRVVIRPGSNPACHIAMFGEDAQPGGVVATAASSEDEADDDSSSDDPSDGITRISDTEFNVRRDLLTGLMANQADLMRMARVIPHEEDGEVVGVKLYGVRRSSLLGRLGVRNGDMLRSINDFDMSSPDAALQAYAQMPTASEINVSLQRRGRDMNMKFNLQD